MQDGTTNRESTKSDLHSRVSASRRQKERLLDLRVEGELSAEVFKARDSKISRQLAVQEELLERATRSGDEEEDTLLTAETLLRLGREAADLFQSSHVDTKRELLKSVCGNLQLDGDTLLYKAKKPFEAMLVATDHSSWLGLVEVLGTLPTFETEPLRRLSTPVPHDNRI